MTRKHLSIYTMPLESLKALFEELGGPEEFDEICCPDHDADESEWVEYREELEAAIEMLRP